MIIFFPFVSIKYFQLLSSEPLHSHLLFLSNGLCHQDFKLIHVYKKLIMQ